MSGNGDPGGPAGGHVVRDGLRIAFLDWGAGRFDADPLVVLHPNGFCAGFFDPLARRIGDQFRVVGVDLRGHGSSDRVVDQRRLGNDDMATDVLAVADHLGLDRFSLLGHSLGGGVSIETAAAAPERVSAVMLCEAIAVGRFEADVEGGAPSLAVTARRRRPVWPDRTTVRASYGSRPPLDALAPEALAAYVRWGFVDRDDGQVELACAPETEAGIFDSRSRHGPLQTFQRLGGVSAPTSVLAGTLTDLAAAWFVEQAEILGTEVVWVEGGHFFLFEDIDRAEGLVRFHLG